VGNGQPHPEDLVPVVPQEPDPAPTHTPEVTHPGVSSEAARAVDTIGAADANPVIPDDQPAQVAGLPNLHQGL
jgi:hypothetical protein